MATRADGVFATSKVTRDVEVDVDVGVAAERFLEPLPVWAVLGVVTRGLVTFFEPLLGALAARGLVTTDFFEPPTVMVWACAVST